MRENLLALGALYSVLVLALWLQPSGVVMIAGFLIVVPVAIVRHALSLHELIHSVTGRDLNVISRLMLVAESPLTVGYDEYRTIHLRHHQHTATPLDPEYRLMRGGSARSFLNALFTSELVFVGWMRGNRLRLASVRDSAARAGVFCLLAWYDPRVLLTYLCIVRPTIAVSQFVFHRTLHVGPNGLGTYALHPPSSALRLLRLVLGRDNTNILLNHDVHHRFTSVRAGQLSLIARSSDALPMGEDR